jgi:hypothetical protein
MTGELENELAVPAFVKEFAPPAMPEPAVRITRRVEK